MAPPRSFKPSIWPGEVISADDVLRAIDLATQERCTVEAAMGAATVINSSIQRFATLSQTIDAPGNLAEYFRKLSKRIDDLLSDICDDSDPNRHAQAMGAFMQFPAAMEASGFDAGDLDDLAAWLEALKGAADLAAKAAAPKKAGHRPKGTPRIELADGLVRAWRGVSGHEGRGFSRPGEASQDRTLRGPFITFSSTILNDASAATRRSAQLKFLADDLAAIAASPDAIADLYDLWRTHTGAKKAK